MLRATITILSLSFSLQAVAGSFDFLPQGNGTEKEFRDLMNNGNFKQALMTWSTAHQASNFADSTSGKATYAYLLYQNGLPYLALNILINETQPARMDAQLLKLWEPEVKNSPFVQKGYIATSGGWRSIVNNENVVVKIKTFKDITKAFARAERAPKEQVNFKARIWWQIATQAPQINQVDSALRATKLLKESGQTVIGQDQVASAQARALFQKGELDAALDAYAQIPKSSPLWIESVEERAWTYLRKDDFDKALGDSITLLSPALAPLVGPESYFFANLMALKACDYPRIFKNSENFKKRQRSRLVELQTLNDKGANKNLNAVLTKFEQKGVSIEAAGPMVESLPRAIYRDRTFVRYMDQRKQILAELDKALEVSEMGKVLGESTILAKAMGEVKFKADRFRQLAAQRARILAQEELKEYRTILNKMHIVEAEVVHRLAVDDSLKGERSKLGKTEDKGDVLVFSTNTDEVWLDELDNYKARVKDCPTLKGAGL